MTTQRYLQKYLTKSFAWWSLVNAFGLDTAKWLVLDVRTRPPETVCCLRVKGWG